MNPVKVRRSNLDRLTDLPNIGPSIAGDLRDIGIHTPKDLIGKDPYKLFDKLCSVTGVRHDLCVLDVFISITRFMDGGKPRPWWDFTAERKRKFTPKTP